MKTKFSIILSSLALAVSVGAGLSISNRNKTIEPVSAENRTPSSLNDYSYCEQSHSAGNASQLVTDLRAITALGTSGSYAALWNTYQTAYVKSDGKMFDYYSSKSNFTPGTDQAGNYTSEGDVYNREHSIPKSWWNQGKSDPATGTQGTDPFFVVPTDGYVNSIRSNYPMGMVNSADYTSDGGFSKRGSAVSSWGYSGTVFEPNDSVKGDFARMHFYVIAKYSQSYNWTYDKGDSTFSGSASTNFGLTDYAVKLFSYWSNLDPVSDWELSVNNKLANIQGNRNPFIDHPEYANTLWSGVSGYTMYTSSGVIVSVSPSSGSISIGETLSLTATTSGGSGSVTWSSSNSGVASVSNSGVVTGVAAGSATITATYSGETATCSVTVTKAVSSLSKGATSPTKTTYTAGESFDSTGLTITATYSDSTTSDVTSSIVWTPDPLTAGTTSVTGTYGGKSITISGLTVNAATEPEIIDSNSDLSVGDYVVLRTAAGIGVTGWNNNKDATVSETQSEWKKFYVSSASNSGFTLKDESANNFIASPGSTNQFIYGSAGTCSTDSDGHLKCNNRYLCKNGTSYRFYTSIGTYLPFFIYKVPASSTKTLSSISVSTAPTKTIYTAGEYFNPSGLVITRTYSDSTSDTYTYADHTSEFTFSPTTSTALTTSNVSVTITYGGKSCNQAITVNAVKTLSSITVQTAPTKLNYVVDEYFNPDGLVITRNYSDSTSDTYSYANHTSEFTFSPSTSTALTVGHTSVTITYGGKSCSQAISVTASGGGGGETEDFSGTYNYGNQGTGSGKTWSLTDCSDQSSYWLCPSTGDESVALIGGIFTDKTITSEVTVTIQSGTYGSGTDPSESTFKIYTSSACTSQVSATKSGTLPTSKTYTNVIYTVSLAIASNFSNDLAIKITKPGKQIRLVSITVEFSYETSSSTDPITSITATPNKTFYVGETITASDITVKGQSNQTVTDFSFTPHTFTYAEAASGGALTNVLLSVSYESLNANFYAQVQRKAYSAPSGTSTLEHTGSEFSTAGIGGSYATGQTATVDGITFSVDGYIYNSKLSLSESKTSAPGKVINTTPYTTGITNVSVSGASPDIQLSVDGSTWVNLASAQTSTTNYFYLKLYFSNTSVSSFVNITSFTVTLKAGETPENVANYIMYEDTNNQCTTKFSIAKTYFENLSNSQRSIFMTSDDYVISTARERLQAWANYLGKTITLSNGDYVILNNNFVSSLLQAKNSNIIAIVTIVSLVGVGTIAGYFFIKRRRPE